MPPPVLAKLQSIASKNGHSDLAAALGREEPPAKASLAQPTPERKRLHVLLDTVLDSGDSDALKAAISCLELAAKWSRRKGAR